MFAISFTHRSSYAGSALVGSPVTTIEVTSPSITTSSTPVIVISFALGVFQSAFAIDILTGHDISLAFENESGMITSAHPAG